MKGTKKGVYTSEVISTSRLNGDTVLLRLKRPGGFPDAIPGQFISIRVSNGTSPLLMRPYSIMALDGEEVVLLVKVVGAGSRMLAEKERGESLVFVGPLGDNPFPEPEGKSITLVAGGSGIAPILFLISLWLKSEPMANVVLLYGGNSSDDICKSLLDDEIEVHFATIDGSLGFKGDVVELCSELISRGDIDGGICYSCGPREMVKALNDAAGKHFEKHYTSLETVMACGVGACRGCTVPVKEGSTSKLATVCSDGPVFEARKIDWDKWTW